MEIERSINVIEFPEDRIMGRIKSAAEIAEEKLAAIGEPTEEERLQWKIGTEGEKLAARYLREDVDLKAELGNFDGKAQEIVKTGLGDILMRNISLPRNDAMRKTTKKAMDGIKLLKKDKSAVENVFARMQQVFDHYTKNGEKQKQDAYEALKQEFEQRFMEAIRQQTGVSGNARMKIDVERQPQFQEEWQRMQAQFESQYTNLLEDYKEELAAIQ